MLSSLKNRLSLLIPIFATKQENEGTGEEFVLELDYRIDLRQDAQTGGQYLTSKLGRTIRTLNKTQNNEGTKFNPYFAFDVVHVWASVAGESHGRWAFLHHQDVATRRTKQKHTSRLLGPVQNLRNEASNCSQPLKTTAVFVPC